jgi:hypothetical protein
MRLNLAPILLLKPDKAMVEKYDNYDDQKAQSERVHFAVGLSKKYLQNHRQRQQFGLNHS